jgi:hypothetical protein
MLRYMAGNKHGSQRHSNSKASRYQIFRQTFIKLVAMLLLKCAVLDTTPEFSPTEESTEFSGSMATKVAKMDLLASSFHNTTSAERHLRTRHQTKVSRYRHAGHKGKI